MVTRKTKINRKRQITRKKKIITYQGGNYKARDVYGTMTIPKDSILYHSSYTEFKLNNTKPMLFLTFHPSDWHGEYVTRIKLKRDITILFMVYPGKIRGLSLHPLLNILINKPGHNLNKQKDSNLRCYVTELQKEGLDGWFSTIEGRTSIEVAIINDNTVYEIVETEEYNNNMINSYTKIDEDTGNAINIPTNWGEKYPISTINLPLILNINSKYKVIIEALQKFTEEGGILFPIQVILNNANITYFDKDIPKIIWKC